MTELSKRELGRTGLEVTMLGYGAMELRGAPRARDISEAQTETILNAVLDSGINYIDTSIDYGLSEERIGRYIGIGAMSIISPANAAAWSARRQRRAASAARMCSRRRTSSPGSSRACVACRPIISMWCSSTARHRSGRFRTMARSMLCLN